ncbi:MAG TPA: UDP-N-acetylmuramate dehydrogenase [Acidimicrobiales bacterium]|nr:UDP-N-acetylmuramate dehydrogenase [Acidimicrobiales bacterium]
MSALDVAAEQLGDAARRDVPLGPYCTYRVGGSAALFVEVVDDDVLARVGAAVAASGLPVLVVGNGSNLLVAEAGFPGIALHLGDRFAGVHVEGTTVRAGGAALLPVVARQSVKAGLTGFEWAVGVPGSIGGAVRMNAGGHGSDMAASLVGVRAFDCRTGEDSRVPASALELGYRRSNVGAHQVVLEATLALSPDEAGTGPDTISEVVRWRRANQPGGQNAGSVFTNPEGDSAGRLVDAAGCKGLRIGTAEVSPKHANFIQADAGGSADDVFAVMVAVRDAVADATGVRLHPETRLVGFDEEVFA